MTYQYHFCSLTCFQHNFRSRNHWRFFSLAFQDENPTIAQYPTCWGNFVASLNKYFSVGIHLDCRDTSLSRKRLYRCLAIVRFGLLIKHTAWCQKSLKMCPKKRYIGYIILRYIKMLYIATLIWLYKSTLLIDSETVNSVKFWILVFHFLYIIFWKTVVWSALFYLINALFYLKFEISSNFWTVIDLSKQILLPVHMQMF